MSSDAGSAADACVCCVQFVIPRYCYDLSQCRAERKFGATLWSWNRSAFLTAKIKQEPVQRNNDACLHIRLNVGACQQDTEQETIKIKQE